MIVKKQKINICVIGLGYVGLPIALKLAKKFNVLGYDINQNRILELQKGIDSTSEIKFDAFKKKNINFTYSKKKLKNYNFFIITVPTPVTKNNRPDLKYLKNASILVSKSLKRRDIVVFESTTYPGCTEEYCIPILEKFSNLIINKDFYCGYSPERINPGDKIHNLENIDKIISATNPEGLRIITNVYKNITKKKLIKVDSIKIAEGAKIIENTQRDINIALMNELSILFKKLNVDFSKVLKAANTKWNFLDFKPGLVGGHCIGVDPYYLASKAKEVNFNTKIILSGREINDDMHKYITSQFKKKLSEKKIFSSRKKILILGLTFKENVSDCRNSQAINIAKSLSKLKCEVYTFDPLVKLKITNCKSINNFTKLKKLKNFFDGIIVLVPHKAIIRKGYIYFKNLQKKKSIFFDLKNTFNSETDFKL